jgi:8-oxo-dGTP pyrophosphatase MutT (NUDIX family)
MTTQRDSIATPLLAATVLLLRDEPDDMEVFMIVRHHESDFAAGALVFPGGRVDPEDYAIAADAALFPPQPGMDATAAALRVAALRETFEECGVLLARGQAESALVGTARLRSIETAHRAAMTRGDRTFRELLAAEALALAPDALVHYAHWITPEGTPKRFDTHFFLAPAPGDQVALHDGTEAVDSVWIAPGTALERARSGTYKLVFPTQMNLQKLARHGRAEAAMAAARASRVVTVLPKVERAAGGTRTLRLPLEAGYGGEVFEVSNPPSMPGRRPARTE